MKRSLLLAFMLFGLIGTAMAQITVKGTVKDDGGLPLPSATVLIKGTTTGTVTDTDGKYSMKVPNAEAVLVFSYVGFETQEITVGNQTTIDVTLKVAGELDEVVVTAVGIEKKERELGYAITGVDSEDLTVARVTDIADGLRGKVSGVQMISTTGIAAQTSVLIRGVTSLNGNNGALFVVDGVPINNGGADGTGITGGVPSYGGASVINPDDIESMNVLKGAAATALYGSRAANGAIIITTKRGSGKKGQTSITVNSSIRFDNLFKVPDFQNSYSGGDLYQYDSSATFSNWGALIEGQEVTKAVTGERAPLRAYDENYKDFYETGLTFINNVALASSSETGDYRLSVTTLNQTGLRPNSELDRITLSLNAGQKHSKKFNSRFGVNFIRTNLQGGGAQGANDPNVIGFTQFVRSVDFNDFSQWIDAAGNQINTIGPQDNNPFWIANENVPIREDDRLIGNFEVNYIPADWLKFTGRAGVDFQTDEFFRSNRVGTRGAADGDFSNNIIQRRQINVDLLGYATKQVNEDFFISGILGFNYNRRVFEFDGNFADVLSVPELFSPGNADRNTPTRDFSDRILMGLYSEVALTYKDYLTLTLTGRNDWSSTLPLDNNSYFYPSATVSFIFTDAFNLKSDILSYGKLRASAARVGSDTGPYQLNFRFFPVASLFGQFGAALTFPVGGNTGFEKTNTVPPTGLLPEEQNSYEFGTELAFLGGRVNLDVSYYKTINKNQILSLPTAQSTGFGAILKNIGQTSSEGIEIEIDADVIKTKNFTWNTLLTYSKNTFLIDELAPGIDRFVVGSGFSSVQVIGQPGKSFELFAIDYLREPTTGRPIINPETGLRQAGEQRSFGDVFPDYLMGWNNSLSYKNFTLNFTVDFRKGGAFRSATVEALYAAGAVEETAVNREGTFIDTEGVLVATDGTVTDNNIPVRSARDFWTSLDDNSLGAAGIFEATYMKLREVGFSYRLPAKLLEKTPLKSVTIGIEGRNLALLYSKVPHIDPESNLFGINSNASGVERNAAPATRSFGFNIRLGF